MSAKSELLSVQQMAACDQATIRAGTPGAELMQRAGAAVAAEIQLRCDGREFLSKEEAVDLNDAITLAADKVVEQAKRARKREVEHPRRKDRFQASAQQWPVEVLTRESVRKGEHPIVVKSSQLQIHAMTISEAALKLEEARIEFVVFRDLENERVSVIYRRNDDDYGLIVPEL